MSSNHRWKFFRAGGVDQVGLRDGRDVVHLPELDPKLWVALAMPTTGVDMDVRTLTYLDIDKDGRIRVPEIVEGVRFVERSFADPDAIVRGGDSIGLASIRDEKVRSAARRVLDALGKKEANEIGLDDIEAHTAIVHKLRLNGDGVIPPGAAEDAETQKVIQDILDTVGGQADKGGEMGVNQAGVDRFFAEADALLAWYATGDGDKALLPLGDGTWPAAEAVRAVRPKLDDYFVRCRLAGFDARAAGALNGTEAEFVALSAKQLSPSEPDLARLPAARVEAGRAFPLKDGINPAWAAATVTFAAAAVAPLLRPGASQLSEGDWEAVKGKLAAHEAWAASKPDTQVAKLGRERLAAIVGGGAKARLDQLVALDAAQEALNQEVAEVERLLLYQRDLFTLLNNFVNFSRFYSRSGALFQAGTLFLDGRGCSLCLEVADPGKHATLAAMAATFLAYCDLTRPGEKKTVVAAFTGGDSENLFVGRNGVFFDRKGRDWDATITRVVANPISVREAFLSPYKKVVRLVEDQIAKRSAAKEAETHGALGGMVTAPEEKAPPPKKVDVGTVAAIAVAIAGFGTMVAGILSAFFGLGVWMPLGLLGLVLLISLPSMILAWLKLRRRNLGPILDANGWAINGRARINVPFGGALTDLARLPQGSDRSLDDPFAEKKRPWALYIVILLVLLLGGAWYLGKLDGWLPPAVRSTTVLGGSAPASK